MRKIYFNGNELTSEDFKKLDYQQGNYLDRICDEFAELPKEEQKEGRNYGEYFIVEVD